MSTPTIAAAEAHTTTDSDLDLDHSADGATEARSGYHDADYDSMGSDRDYVGASR